MNGFNEIISILFLTYSHCSVMLSLLTIDYRGKVRQIKTAAVTKLNVSNLHCCDLPFKITEHVRGCVAQNFIHGRVVLKKCLNPHIILKLMEP